MNNLTCEDCLFHCGFKDEETKAMVRARCRTTSRVKRIYVNDFMSVEIAVEGKVTNKDYPKNRRPKREFFYGPELYKKENKWVHKDREIDRAKDRYREIVIDPDTGEVIHECEHPLSEHKEHGSAKFNKTF
ncbi:MAG: hypothetical protein AB1650_01655 [Candidatus Omnitrophota bacterium]